MWNECQLTRFADSPKILDLVKALLPWAFFTGSREYSWAPALFKNPYLQEALACGVGFLAGLLTQGCCLPSQG